MERVKERYRDLDKPVLQFEGSILLLEEYKKQKMNDIRFEIAFRDSVIKRFELCYDLLWKCLKDYLTDQFGIEVASPKKVFQECFNQKIISQEQLKEALVMSDDRNLTVHTYDDQMASDVAGKAISHLNLILQLFSLITYNEKK